jgi:hypothetical protein
MNKHSTDVYGVVSDIMQSFERMACAAEITAESANNERHSEDWYLIAQIWMEAHMLAAHRLSIYLAEQMQARLTEGGE